MKPSDTETKTIEISNSIYVRIPKPFCKELEIVNHTLMDIDRKGKKIIFSKKEPVTNDNKDQPVTEGGSLETPVCPPAIPEGTNVVRAAASAAIHHIDAGERAAVPVADGQPPQDGSGLTDGK